MVKENPKKEDKQKKSDFKAFLKKRDSNLSWDYSIADSFCSSRINKA